MKIPAFLGTYRTEKFIKVDVPRVGLFFRFGQLMAFFLIFVQLYFNDAWGLVEVPGGTVNVWDEPGQMLRTTNIPGYAETQPYCSNESYSYSSNAYLFYMPECQGLLAAELTQKGATDLFFTTAFLETVTLGWPCPAAGVTEPRDAACVADGGATYMRANGQCGCVTQKPIFPLAVEDMVLAYEHAYQTSQVVGMRGSSADSPDLYSLIMFGNGSQVRFEAGRTIRLPVRDWLSSANVSLDALNYDVPVDSTGAHPPIRTTGAKVNIEIEYSNIDPETGRAVPGKLSVHANVRTTQEGGTWTSAGVEKFWVQYPMLPRSTPQEYHLVERWKQGVRFQFTTTGRIHKFDWFFLLSVVLSGLVMLKFANTATNFYAFNCLGAESVILRNKRCELVSKKGEFAEIGMKAALAATTYPKFDRFCDGTIEAEDIARAFAHVEGVPWETAFMIARNILADADSEPSVGGEPKGLNFVEFMTCIEGDSCNFELFLKDTKDMFDKYMLEDEAEDAAAAAAAGKKMPKKPAGPTLKEKIKMEKEAEKKKKEAREAKIEAAMEALKKQAEAAGKDFDDFMKDKEEAEDDAMRTKCKEAYEAEVAEIAKHNPNKGAKAAAPAAAEPGATEPAAAADAAAEPDVEAADAPKPSPPVSGAAIEQSDEEKEERLGKMGTLRMKLTSASGLKAMDKSGTSDPYVVVIRGKKKKTSKVCKKTLEPSWDEEFEFVNKVSLRKVIKEGLELKIFDKDGFLDSDDLMGTVTVDLSLIESTDSITFCEEVSSGGVIRFSVAWEAGESVSGEKKEEAKPEDVKADVEAPAAEAPATEEKPKKKKKDKTPKKEEAEPDVEKGEVEVKQEL